MWERRFDGTDACVVPVLTLDEATRHPHVVARQVFHRVGDRLQPGPGAEAQPHPGSGRRTRSTTGRALARRSHESSATTTQSSPGWRRAARSLRRNLLNPTDVEQQSVARQATPLGFEHLESAVVGDDRSGRRGRPACATRHAQPVVESRRLIGSRKRDGVEAVIEGLPQRRRVDHLVDQPADQGDDQEGRGLGVALRPQSPVTTDSAQMSRGDNSCQALVPSSRPTSSSRPDRGK